MSTAVASIVKQQQVPVNRTQENSGYYRICFKRWKRAKECPVGALQFKPLRFQHREINKGDIPYKKSRAPSHGWYWHYRHQFNPSYRFSTNLTVTRGINNTRIVYQVEPSSSWPTQKNWSLTYEGRTREKNFRNVQELLRRNWKMLAPLRTPSPPPSSKVQLILALHK